MPDQTIQDFANTMQAKINLKNSIYGDFHQYTKEQFVQHLEQEIMELRQDNYSPKECLDVANLCYMIWATELEAEVGKREKLWPG